jgi:hypothetical protein
MIYKTIFLLLTIILILYIYDRNITILDNLNFNTLNYVLKIIFNYIDKLYTTNINESFNTQNIEIEKEVMQQVPESQCLKSLFNTLDNEIVNTQTTPIQYHIGKAVRANYYSNKIYQQILAVINDTMPHHQMSYLLDTQHKILKIIHDFIFTTPGSQIPIHLQKLEHDFKTCFNTINKKLTKINNEQFIYNSDTLNTNSGFIFSNGSDPVPNNTFYDNHNYY